MGINNHVQSKRLFKADNGRIVLWQRPNVPIIGWLLFKILSMLVDNPRLKGGFGDISSAFLFTWAFLEITQGVNYFRRLLGVVVLVALAIGFFKQ